MYHYRRRTTTFDFEDASHAVTAEQLLASRKKRGKKIKKPQRSGSNIKKAALHHHPSIQDFGGLTPLPWRHRLIDLERKDVQISFEYTIEDVEDEIPRFIYWVHLWDVWWQWFIMAMCIVSFFLITYVSIFAFFIPDLFTVVYTIDVIFLIDTVIRISIEFWRYFFSIPYVVLFSPYTFSSFKIDAFSLIPFERLVSVWNGLERLDFVADFDFFRYNRFLRFYRIFTFLTQAENERKISERAHFLLKYFLIYLGFVQFVACIYKRFLGVSTVDILLQREHDFTHTWMEDIQHKKPVFKYKEWDMFTLAFYFALSVVTTTGYGDMEAAHVGEMVFSIFVMLVGAIVFPGLFTSGLTNFELKLDGARYDLFFRVDALIQYLTDIGMHPLARKKVREFYPLLWNFREGVLEVPFFSSLPRSMQEDIKFDYCQEMFHKSYLFRGIEEAFLRAVASRSDVVLYNPDMVLCSIGTYAQRMYFVIQGELIAESKHKIPGCECIFRSGCIIGEMKLFFSYPYSNTLYTRTCCQMLKIEKEDLFELLEHYPLILETFRSRVQKRLLDLDKYHTEEGTDPITWIQAKETLGYAVDGNIPANDFPVVIRSGTGFNTQILDDIYDDTNEQHIIDMPCIDQFYQRRHTLMYESCLVPNILVPTSKWVGWWTTGVMVMSFIWAFLEPYCFAFNVASGFTSLLCRLSWHEFTNWVMFCLYSLDVFVEVTESVPSSGIYYKCLDGIQVMWHKPGFWLDVAAAMPLFLFKTKSASYYFNLLTVIIRCLKLWKIKRYFNFLDNKNPSNVFYYRLTQTIVVLLYATHFLSCIYFVIACPAATREHPPICEEFTWLSSYQLKDHTKAKLDYRYLGTNSPYLLSFYFASATLSTTGFGDFNPQNHAEMYATSVFELLSFFILCYYTAILTSALSCIVRPKLAFQKKLSTVKLFMDHYGIEEPLQKRVLEHHKLQNQLWQGIGLPESINTYLYDTPKNFHDDALYLEFDSLFNNVPLLEKIDPKLTIKIAKDLRKYLIPPGVIFLRKSEVRRQMYILAKGSCGVFSCKDLETPIRIIEQSCHFAMRDLMFGEPAHHHMKTLSYCLIYEIELRDLNILLERDPELDELITRTKETMKDHIDAMVVEYSLHSVAVVEQVRSVKSWFIMPTAKVPTINCTLDEFIEPFNYIRGGRFYRWFLMDRTVNPVGRFAKFWTVLQSINSYLVLLALITEGFMSIRILQFRVFQYILDLCNIMDIYVKMHWAYYEDKKNILVTHPLQTAIHYIFEGSFILDVAFCFPYEFILFIASISDIAGTHYGIYWYTKFRMIRMGQVLRLPLVMRIVHNIFRHRTTILTIMYMLLTLWMCTALSAIACNIACPTGQNQWNVTLLGLLPSCKRESWVFTKGGLAMKNYWQRWVFGSYYVTQVLLVIGFGDMITLNRSETLLLVFMMLFGFVIIRCILADITSAQVEFDETRVDYYERMCRLEGNLLREKAPDDLVQQVVSHVTHTWDQEKGLQPWKLLAELHPSLQADVFKSFVGDTLKKVPLFRSLTDNVLRNMCQHLDKEFFQPGEVIKRYGNLEPEMYILLDGRAWVTKENLEWVYTLHRGESFGDCSLVLGSRNMYNVIAASHVEVFSINLEGFKTLLEKYPEVSDELTRKLAKNKSRDMFEFVEERRVLHSQVVKSQTKKIIEFFRTRKGYIDDFIEMEPRYKSNLWRKYICSYGPEKDNPPFLYFLTKEKDQSFRFLFHPKCGFIIYFNEVQYIVWGLSPAFVVYDVCFTVGEDQSILYRVGIIYGIIITLEVIIIVRMICEFFLPIKYLNQRYTYSHKSIAFRYLTQFWESFWLELLALLPTYLMGDTPKIRMLALIRCIRWAQFLKFNDRSKDALTSNTVRKQVMITVFIFILISHIIACIFYIISPCKCVECPVSDVCLPLTWTFQFVSDHGFIDKEKKLVTDTWRWYIRSVYWVITTVSTTGFGGITPRNVPETLLGIVCIFAGSFALSIILSQFTSGISTLTRSKREYAFQVNILTTYYTNIGMSKQRRDVLASYYDNLWIKCKGVPYHFSYDFLPIALKGDVCCGLYYDVLKNCELFQPSTDTSFVRQLCARVKHTYFLPGTNIATEGDSGDCLYIVYRGSVTGYNIEEEEIAIKGVYTVSEEFGKLPAFFHKANYAKTYRAETHVEVLSVSQVEILVLATYFPAFALHIKNFIKENYGEVSGVGCIFKKPRKPKVAKEMSEFVEIFRNQPSFVDTVSKEKYLAKKKKEEEDKKREKEKRRRKAKEKKVSSIESVTTMRQETTAKEEQENIITVSTDYEDEDQLPKSLPVKRVDKLADKEEKFNDSQKLRQKPKEKTVENDGEIGKKKVKRPTGIDDDE